LVRPAVVHPVLGCLPSIVLFQRLNRIQKPAPKQGARVAITVSLPKGYGNNH
jgi:hypothetical protein